MHFAKLVALFGIVATAVAAPAPGPEPGAWPSMVTDFKNLI